MTPLQQERAALRAQIPVLIGRALEMIRRLPQEHQSWGVVRTRAYVVALERLQAATTSVDVTKTIPPLRIARKLAERVAVCERMATADIQVCAEYIAKPIESRV